MKDSLLKDQHRYTGGKIPTFQKYFRKYQSANNFLLKIFYKILFRLRIIMNHIEISGDTKIGGVIYRASL